MNLREREYHYAACDLLEKYREVADEYFLAEYVEELLTTKSWWDTVDGLGSSIVSPLCWRYEATDLVLGWSRSPNIWLNRAAIQHQRGWKKNTDIPFVLELCDAHSESSSSPRPSAGLFATSPASTPTRFEASYRHTRA